MADIVGLSEAVPTLVHDGDCVAMQGFTHLIPFAAGHEIIRQGRRDLTLVRLTPDVIFDQLIGTGCASKLIFAWGQVTAATGWELAVCPDIAVTEPPSAEELLALRALQAASDRQ